MSHAIRFRLRWWQQKILCVDPSQSYRLLSHSSVDLTIKKRSIATLPWCKNSSKIICEKNSYLLVLGQRHCASFSSSETGASGGDNEGKCNRRIRRLNWSWLTTSFSLAGALLFALLVYKEKPQAKAGNAIGVSAATQKESSLVEKSSVSSAKTPDNLTVQIPEKAEKRKSHGQRVAIADVIENTSKSVVGILATYYTKPDYSNNENGSRNSYSSGTGFIFHKDGLILTNAHVIEEKSNMERIGLKVRLHDGRIVAGQVLCIDRQTDVVIIGFRSGGFPALRLGNSEDMRTGELVALFGSQMVVPHRVTAGTVERVKWSGHKFLGDHFKDMLYFKSHVSFMKGCSGGPLVNMDGEVIGMNTMFLGNAQDNLNGSDVALSIPTDHLNKFINGCSNIIRIRHSFGLTLANKTGGAVKDLEWRKNWFSNHRINRGSPFVSQVLHDSPAYLSGIMEGDVIIKINDHDHPTASVVIDVLKSAQTAQIVVMRREGKNKTEHQFTLCS